MAGRLARRQHPLTAPSVARSGAPAVGLSAGGRPGVTARRSALAAVALLVTLVLSILVLRGTGLPGGAGDPAPFEHVHGLGLNPADGTVYAGTHHGLFQLPGGGAPIRVADRVQDFMGFTVVGPDHFLASGHPESGSAGPSSLGLIESMDGGVTWTSLSLAGRADFHALQARHGGVYGYNSLTGAFMVSADKQTWETRARLALADFVVSPTDPDVVLATTEHGVVRSADGGRSFAPMAAPGLLLISWPEIGGLVGVTPEGVVQVSNDQGATWQQRGSINGSPEALEATSATVIYAAADGAVSASTDGGWTFATLGSG